MATRDAEGQRSIFRALGTHASPDRLWRALTRSEELPAWLCDGAAADVRLGGSIELHWAEGKGGLGVSELSVVDCQPPRKLVLRAGERSYWPGTMLTFETAANGQTMLTFRQEGFRPGFPVHEYELRWSGKLEALRHYVETGRVLIRPLVAEKAREDVAAREAGILMGALDLVASELGQEAAERLWRKIGDSQARHFQGFRIESPLHLASILARESYTLYGDEVEVEGDAERCAFINHGHAVFDQARRMGLASDFESFCSSRANETAALAAALGFKSETQITPDGYLVVMTR